MYHRESSNNNIIIPASVGDEEEGEKAQADNFSEPIRFEAGRSRSGRPTTRYVLRQSTIVIKPGKVKL